jgi:plasmid stability protein
MRCERLANLPKPHRDITAISAWLLRQEERPVGQLIVRNVDDELVRALKIRAAQKRRSAEAEHREILREALASPRKRRTLKDVLLEMPGVGDDADFERLRDSGRKTRL